MEPEKIYLSSQQLRDDSYRLADQIIRDNFHPAFLVALWRGGTPVGIAVQEYLHYFGFQTDHISIRTSSYGDETVSREVRVHGLDYLIERVLPQTPLLVVDDVLDTGNSGKAVIDCIREKARFNTPTDIRFATIYYKPEKNQTDLKPHYCIHELAGNPWLVFPHELTGLTAQEIVAAKGAEVSQLMGATQRFLDSRKKI